MFDLLYYLYIFSGTKVNHTSLKIQGSRAQPAESQ